MCLTTSSLRVGSCQTVTESCQTVTESCQTVTESCQTVTGSCQTVWKRIYIYIYIYKRQLADFESLKLRKVRKCTRSVCFDHGENEFLLKIKVIALLSITNIIYIYI